MSARAHMRVHLLVALLTPFTVFATDSGMERHPDSGVALIWYGNQDGLGSRGGLVTVGQIMYQWRDFEPEPDRYAFEDLDRQLRMAAKKGLKATIQINGNRHPDYLYRLVPYLKGVQLPSTRDHLDGFGPLMYWSEEYMDRYSRLLHALAGHLRQSPYRQAVLAIRQNNNAIGTEHHTIPPAYRSPAGWTAAAGARSATRQAWTEEVARAYKRWALQTHLEAFRPPADFRMFVRAGFFRDGLATVEQLEMVERGDLWIFETSSEPQPRNQDKERQFKVFVDYCRSGKTLALMESWSAARERSEGWNWDSTRTPITQAQFNYWGLLCDLHCGATFIARRPEDVDVPAFREDYAFAARYAGWLQAPKASPGAWIFFREGDWLKGDYSFLMHREPSVHVRMLYNVDTDKRGLWALEMNPDQSLILKLDGAFARSLASGLPVTYKLWYKDVGHGDIRINVFGHESRFPRRDSGRWECAQGSVVTKQMENTVRITTSGGPLTVHGFELMR